MKGQLNQLTNYSRPSNVLSDDDEHLQQNLIEEACQRQ